MSNPRIDILQPKMLQTQVMAVPAYAMPCCALLPTDTWGLGRKDERYLRGNRQCTYEVYSTTRSFNSEHILHSWHARINDKKAVTPYGPSIIMLVSLAMSMHRSRDCKYLNICYLLINHTVFGCLARRHGVFGWLSLSFYYC